MPTPAPLPIADPGAAFRTFSVYPARRFIQLAAGFDVFCGLQQDGRVFCWGHAGVSNYVNYLHNVLAFATFRQIAVGRGFFCGIRSDNAIQCVGNYADILSRPAPRGHFHAVSAGKDHACALDQLGAPLCWGEDTGGSAAPSDNIRFTAIAAGNDDTCALDSRRELHCWGRNFAFSAIATAPPGPYQSLALGRRSKPCALHHDGTVWCLADAGREWFRPAPAAVFTQVTSGQRHGCGINAAGTVQCWGNAAAAGSVPPGPFTAVAANRNDTCGLRPEGYAECWGPSNLVWPDYSPPAPPPPSAAVSPAFAGRAFAAPVDLFPWPDGATAVVERAGSINSYTSAGAARLILDLTASTTLDGYGWGMLSAALDPDFDRFPYLYVYYHRQSDNPAGESDDRSANPVVARLSRFPIVNGAAIPQDELPILELSERDQDHQGGAIRFGPDGMLYLGLGDNFAEQNAASLSNLNGKIIRIDVRNASAALPYRIPDDNPFIATPGARPEIYAYGLRNPWRMDFDRQGRLWVGDVGKNHAEELSLVGPGDNLGWPVFEGTYCRSDEHTCAASLAVPPVIEYYHTHGCAITGVVAHSKYDNTVIYSDLCSGRVWALTGNPQAGWQTRLIIHDGHPVLSLNADADGNVYLLRPGRPILRLEWPP